MNKIVETITATDDAGNEYTLSVWQTFLKSVTTGGTQLVPGLKTILDEHGHHVNVVDYDNGEFIVVETGTKLKRK
jgi:hypothetical protein